MAYGNKPYHNIYKVLFLLFFLIFGCKPAFNGTDPVSVRERKAPYNIEEFRAAWVATVANINWPGKPGLPVNVQREEAIKILDFLESHNFNAVVLQVRPQADALYRSELEPWSYYLTGEQGVPPAPFYDPLEFWIEEAHKRGLELHAWLNPYRAHHTEGKGISEKSVVKTRPGLVVELANGMWWMDPGLEETREHSLAVIMDIANRYDIDGIHFDDYFYPYDSYNNGKDFPDDKSWQQYKNSGGKLSRGDWRRDNVSSFIKKVYREIKREKPYVKFGLSPFGIWRPGYPESVRGYDQYEKLYADARLWLNEGWIDYFSPQLYWKISQIGQSFPELLGWWAKENTCGRHLWPGIKIDRGGGRDNATEVVNQIMITRGILQESKGTVHWSIGPLMKYDTLSKKLVEGPYRNKALVPASPWLDSEPPKPPELNVFRKKGKVYATWTHPGRAGIFKWVLYYQYRDEKWKHTILTKEHSTQVFDHLSDKGNPLLFVGMTAVDRSGNQSVFIKMKTD